MTAMIEHYADEFAEEMEFDVGFWKQGMPTWRKDPVARRYTMILYTYFNLYTISKKNQKWDKV
jgi:hypothetical protein